MSVIFAIYLSVFGERQHSVWQELIETGGDKSVMFTGLMYRGKHLLNLLVLSFFLLSGSAYGEKKEEEDPKKKELKELMKKVDKWYKASQERMGYYVLSESDWDTLLKSGENISKLSDIVLQKYTPPDDKTYLNLIKEMKKRADEIVKSATERYEGAYEDIQYSFGRLRNSCKDCHSHLGIQIYADLYPGEASHKGEEKGD